MVLRAKGFVLALLFIVSIGVGYSGLFNNITGSGTPIEPYNFLTSNTNETQSPVTLQINAGSIVNGSVTSLTSADQSYLTISPIQTSTEFANVTHNVVITTGSVTNGTLVSTHSQDASPHAIDEERVSSRNRMDVYYQFHVPGRLERYSTYVYSTAQWVSEDFNIYIYNWTRDSWDFLTRMNAHTTYTWFNISFGNDVRGWVNDSTAYIRYTDTLDDRFSASRDTLWIDYQVIESVVDHYLIEYDLVTHIPQLRSALSYLAVNYTGMSSVYLDSFSLSTYNVNTALFDSLGSINTTTATSLFCPLDAATYANPSSVVIIRLAGSLSTATYYQAIIHYNDLVQFIYSDTPPQYYNVKGDADNSYYTGKMFSFNATWIDNYQMDTVTFTLNATNYTLTMTAQNTFNEYYVSVPLLLGSYTYQWTANDTYGNMNATPIFAYTVVDKSPPVITSVGFDAPETTPQYFDTVEIGANVSEPDYECGIREVLLYYGVGTPLTLTGMGDGDNDSRYTGFIPAFPTGSTISYFITATDNLNNTVNSTVYQYTVEDRVPPSISGVIKTPDSLIHTTDSVTVSATIADAGSAISTPIIVASWDGDQHNFTMTWIGGSSYSGTIPPLSNATLVSFNILTNDSYGNSATSPTSTYRTNALATIQVRDNHLRPIESAIVTLNSSVQGISDANGIVVFDFPQGIYPLTITHGSYIPVSKPIVISSDATLPQVVDVLNYTLNIVIYKEWSPLELVSNPHITIVNTVFGDSVVNTPPSGAGSFDLENGTYYIVVEKEDYETESQLIQLTNDFSAIFYLTNNQPSVLTNIQPAAKFTNQIPVTVSANDPDGIARVEFYFNGFLVHTDTYEWDGWAFTIDVTPYPNDPATIRILVFDTEGACAERVISVEISNGFFDVSFEIVISFLTSITGIALVIIGGIVGGATSFYHRRKHAFFIVLGATAILSIAVLLSVYMITQLTSLVVQTIMGFLLFAAGVSLGLGAGFVARRTVLQTRLQQTRDACIKDPSRRVCKYVFGNVIPDTIVVYRSVPKPFHKKPDPPKRRHQKSSGIL